jgi:hypothetical protein
MGRIFPALAILTGAALLSQGRVAFADPESSAKAEVLFKEGLVLVQQGTAEGDSRKLEEATRKFLTAYGFDPRPNALFNAALTEQKLNRPAEAIHHFRQILHNPACDSKLTAQVGKHIAELAPNVATIQLDAPPGAEILVDGASLGEKAPLADPIDLMPGRHAIQARSNGATSIEIDALAGTKQVLRIETATPPGPTSSAPVTTSSQPPRPIESAPSNEPRAAVDQPAAESSPPFWTTRRKLAVGVAGVGVASLVVSGIFGAESNSDKNQANSIKSGLNLDGCTGAMPPSACSALNSAYAAQDREWTLSRVFLGVGIAGIAAGAALFLWPQSSAGAPHTTVAPLALPHGGGLQLRGEL